MCEKIFEKTGEVKIYGKGSLGGKGAGLMKDALELKEVRYRPVGEDIMAEGYLRRPGD